MRFGQLRVDFDEFSNLQKCLGEAPSYLSLPGTPQSHLKLLFCELTTESRDVLKEGITFQTFSRVVKISK